MTSDSPPEVDALYAGVTRLFDLTDSLGRKVGDCTRGVYLFIDYDDEPIYVGQTICRRQCAERSCPPMPGRAESIPTFAWPAACAPSRTWPASSASDK